jgi:hypothetical protein
MILSDDKELLGILSKDGRISISKVCDNSDEITPSNEITPVVFRYPVSNPPIGISFSNNSKSLIVYLQDGKVDIIHLDLEYYCSKLRPKHQINKC